VDATVGAAQRDGAALCVPPTDIPGVGRFAMILDPQQVATYVMAPAPVTGESRSFAALPGHCQWNELVTSDPDGALAFYTRHFGWQKGEAMPMGPLGTYQLLVNDGVQIGEDIDAAVKVAQAAGGKLVDQVMPTPNGFAAVIIDPQGAEFGIAGPRKG
jgi:predicted enzyme related to lactoylglutathione lyase